MGEITKLYKGYQTVVPSQIRKKLNINQIASFDNHFDGKEGIVPISL
ncbi:hypothetical protein SDC9_21293 [bioreactor metagenome]|uniref:Uncharacterized protein n=1 Tax=bioreactor metagenome TaxID=1076179 RepID=A0A644U952_9ZZZZ|nr:hypothetical protein [Methanobrevibacter sp.]MEA4957647.1 hypothetical protein [Methanobrevibacter sp.]